MLKSFVMREGWHTLSAELAHFKAFSNQSGKGIQRGELSKFIPDPKSV